MGEPEIDFEIERLNRLYAAFTRVSDAVVRFRSRGQLLGEVARALVEVGKYAMVVIAWYEPSNRELVPVAHCGDENGCVGRIRIVADEPPEGQDPDETAFRQGAPCVCNDLLNDPRTRVRREAARSSGWQASASIPILIGGEPRGLVSVYALERGRFGAKEVESLQQVAAHVALGLERVDTAEQTGRSEEGLWASERRLKLAMDAAGIGTFDWDLVSGKIVWDGHHERLFGFPPGGFDGTYAAFQDRVHRDDLLDLDRAVDLARDTRTAFAREFRIVWPDGSIHWIGAHGEFYYSKSGLPNRMCGTVVDINERKRAEAALLKGEERLRQAVRVSNIGIFDHDHAADTIYWSEQQRAIHGWGPSEPVTLQVYFARVHPEDLEKITAAVRRAHDPEGDGLFDVEHRLVLPDGSIRWTSTRSQTFFEGDGYARRPVRTVGAVQDITERKQAEEEQKKLATVVAMSRDFIGIANLDGQVAYLNDAAMSLVGIETIEEARQKNIFDFFPDSHQAQVRDGLYATVRGAGFWSGESRLRHFRTGNAIDVEIMAFQIHDNCGAPLYIASVVRDMTERKKTEADRAKLEAQLFQAQKMESVGRLAGGVAHDFNNMLTVILGYAALIKTTFEPGDERLSNLEEMEKAANRSRGITRQLLGFSRRQIIAPKTLNLNDLVADLEKVLARLIGEDIELRFFPAQGLWPVLADPSQVHQVLLNLAINARDAMPNGGKLTIKTENVELSEESCRTQAGASPGPFVVLAVSDSGIGMSPETLSHLFEPFFTTKETGRGTGLGLATVYGIVNQNGGFVNVHSELGEGTTFKIHFPRMMAAGESFERTPPAVAITGSGTILLVEDDELVRKMTTIALKKIGYTPLVAASAEEALEMCAQSDKEIGLMLTDVVMPGMNGAELRDRVRRLRPRTKVLFMSGYTSDVIVQHGVLEKGVHFIQKPFTVGELARRLAEMLAAE